VWCRSYATKLQQEKQEEHLKSEDPIFAVIEFAYMYTRNQPFKKKKLSMALFNVLQL
jgi:hypothetical protein